MMWPGLKEGCMQEEWLRKALNITSVFEGENQFENITGDFDKMSLSLGALQWNLGQNSLQPLLKDFWKEHGEEKLMYYMPTMGNIIKLIIQSNDWATQMELGRQPQKDKNKWFVFRHELRSFLGSPEMVKIQLKYCSYVGNKAYRYAEDWAKNFSRGPLFLEFCFMFDIVTQNGSLRDFGYKSVDKLVSAAGLEGALDVALDWLDDVKKTQAGYKDAIKNHARFQSILAHDESVKDYQKYLFILAFQRSSYERVIEMWRYDVMNRKSTISLGTGWVHSEFHDLRRDLGLIQ